MASFNQQGHARMVDNRFRILETLGTGCSGKVKRAVDHRTGEMVAMKVMDRPDPDDPHSARRFSRLQAEVDSMRRCGGHEHVMSLLEARFNTIYPTRSGDPAEAHILILELCEKGELFDVLMFDEDDPVSPVVCKEYFRQLMRGIKFCHDQGVSHRDLKPENLLLDSDFTLKIADFGFAASGREQMICHSIVGSKAYMAPEVLKRTTTYADAYDEGYDGRKADVWSAGVILFMMLSGNLPMERAASHHWWFDVLNAGRPDLFWQAHDQTGSHVPGEARDLISAMLTVDPSSRIGVDEIMNHPYLSSGINRNVLRQEMQARYDRSLASRRMLTVAGRSSSRGTAGSTRTDSSGSPPAAAAAAASAAAAGAGGFVPNPYGSYTWRSSGDDRFKVPTMTEEAAARVTRGFMAVGSVRNVVKAVEHSLFDMGAEIKGVNKTSRVRALRATNKVSAVIPADKKAGGGDVNLVVKVFRVVVAEASPDGGSPSKIDTRRTRCGRTTCTAAKSAQRLVVVFRRKGGDYYRYLKVAGALATRLGSEEGRGAEKKKGKAGGDVRDRDAVNKSPRP